MLGPGAHGVVPVANDSISAGSIPAGTIPVGVLYIPSLPIGWPSSGTTRARPPTPSSAHHTVSSSRAGPSSTGAPHRGDPGTPAGSRQPTYTHVGAVVDPEAVLTEFLTIVADPNADLARAKAFFTTKVQMASEQVHSRHTQVKHTTGQYRAKVANLALISAAAAGHIRIVEWLLKEIRADVTYQNEDNCGLTALMAACDVGAYEVAELLLQFGADPNQCTFSPSYLLNLSEGDTPLLIATFRGYGQLAALIVQHGGNVNAANAEGSTPLAFAAYHGDVATMRLLISCGADLEAASQDGFTPLMLAARNGHSAAVGLLLRAGAPPDLRNRGGFTALMAACQAGHDSVSTPADHDYSAEEGDILAETQLENDDVGVPWKAAAQLRKARNLTPWTVHRRVDALKLLLSAGASLHATSNRGSNCLHLAAASGKLTFVDELLCLLIPNAPSQNPSQARMVARLLHARDDSGAQPHDVAYSRGHFTIAKRLETAMEYLGAFADFGGAVSSKECDGGSDTTLDPEVSHTTAHQAMTEDVPRGVSNSELYNFTIGNHAARPTPTPKDAQGTKQGARRHDPASYNPLSSGLGLANELESMKQARINAEIALQEMIRKHNISVVDTAALFQSTTSQPASPPPREQPNETAAGSVDPERLDPEPSRHASPAADHDNGDVYSELSENLEVGDLDWDEGGIGGGEFVSTNEDVNQPFPQEHEIKSRGSRAEEPGGRADVKRDEQADEELQALLKRSREVFARRAREEELAELRRRQQQLEEEERSKRQGQSSNSRPKTNTTDGRDGASSAAKTPNASEQKQSATQQPTSGRTPNHTPSFAAWFSEVSTSRLDSEGRQVKPSTQITREEMQQTMKELNDEGSFIRSIYEDLRQAEALAASGKLSTKPRARPQMVRTPQTLERRGSSGAFSPAFAEFLTRVNATSHSSHQQQQAPQGTANSTSRVPTKRLSTVEAIQPAPLIVKMLKLLHKLLPPEDSATGLPLQAAYPFAAALSPKSTFSEIRRAYLEALKVVHPDKQAAIVFANESAEQRKLRVENSERAFQQLRDAFNAYQSASSSR